MSQYARALALEYGGGEQAYEEEEQDSEAWTSNPHLSPPLPLPRLSLLRGLPHHSSLNYVNYTSSTSGLGVSDYNCPWMLILHDNSNFASDLFSKIQLCRNFKTH